MGRLYSTPIPNGDIQIMPIRGEHEELLAGSGEQNASAIMRQITQSLCVLPDGFPFQELLVSDWVAITFGIMAASYSPELTLTPECPKCKFRLHETRSLDQIPCVTAEDFGEDYKEPFEAILPISKQKVEFNLLRLRHLAYIEDYAQQFRRKKIQMKLGDPTYTLTLSSYIFSINGDTNLSDMARMKWVRDNVAGDNRALRAAVDAKETGYDLKPEFDCPSCGEVFRTQVPIDFFRSFSPQS